MKQVLSELHWAINTLQWVGGALTQRIKVFIYSHDVDRVLPWPDEAWMGAYSY